MKSFIFVLLLSVSIHARYFKCNRNLSCGCGYQDVEINARIINGEEAVPYSWSMIVSIRYNLLQNGDFLQHACGGTILTESYILTAASCLVGLRNNIESANVTIAAGIHRRSHSFPTVREVDDMIVHPKWTNSWDTDYDIALLHLSEPLYFQFNPLISRTCVSAQLNNTEELLQYPPTNTTLAIAGWGRTVSSGEDSDLLRQIFVSSIDADDAKCVAHVMNPIRQFCAGLHKDSAGPCLGDFGGPIFQWMDDHWEQIGIASFTSDGCKTNSIVGYTRLAYYHDWIEENIRNDTNETTIVTLPPIDTTTRSSQIYQCDRHAVSCGCGRRHVQISDSDNHEAIPYSWSMVVSIRLNNHNKHSCSGSILSESYILTSASCLANASSAGITIVAGIHNHSEDNGIYRKVDQIFFHPDYLGAANNHLNDVAILHLSERLNLENNLFVNRICLPKKFDAFPNPIYYPAAGARLIVTGWGLMNCENRIEQPLLQQAQLSVADYSEKSCLVLDDHRHIQFCAGLIEENTVPCVLDPGSPIFEWYGDRWQQVGIASYGVDCTQFKNLQIYTRLVEYNDWIESIINSCSIPSPTPTPTMPSTTPSMSTVDTSTTAKTPELYRCNHTLTCGCGAVPVVLTPTRIIGGEKAVEYSWPMMVSLGFPNENNHWCGGTILSKSHILTAAHCLFGWVENPPTDLSISVGMTNLTDTKRIRRTVDRIHIHPGYIGEVDGTRHDIALMHVDPPLPMGNNLFVTKTCIHPLGSTISHDQYIKNGTRLTVIGWGFMDSMGLRRSALLQQIEVYAIDNEDPICKATVNDSETQLCAGLHEGGKDACKGDSGGPIFRWTGDYWEQVGVVSRGNGCAEAGNPGVYTRLSYYYNWINDILKNDTEELEPRFPSNETSTGSNTTTSSTNTSSITSISTTIPSTNTRNITNVSTTNQPTSTRENNASNRRENTLLFSVFSLLFSIALH